MPIARSKQVILSQTSYYHCISRCVRQAYLCGVDKLTGKNYEYRRAWFEKRLNKLSSAFAIDVCAYAIMHNHNHLVLHVDTERAKSWSTVEVIQRWHAVHAGTILTQMYLDPAKRINLSHEELGTIQKVANVYRERLSNISFFMKALNQNIAIRANREDNCSGKFWESRFKSQALLDERAVLSCMIYVDLNPIRAGIATTLENSKYTSIKKRLNCFYQAKQPEELKNLKTEFGKNSNCVNIELQSYVQLLRQTAKHLQTNKLTQENNREHSKLLSYYGINQDHFLTLASGFESVFSYVVGSVTSMEKYRKKLNQKRLKGTKVASRLFT